MQNGRPQMVDAHAPVTAAQYAALNQALAGRQTLTVDQSGAATGGSFSIKNDLPAGSSMVIPAGINALANFSTTSPMNVADLTNFGNVYAFSLNGMTAGTITANTIINAALITSVTPPSVVADLQGTLTPHFDLSLIATSITNNGVISSSGNLTLQTTTLTNPAGAMLQANDSVLINASVIHNEGAINATNGTITILTDGTGTVGGGTVTTGSTPPNFNLASTGGGTTPSSGGGNTITVRSSGETLTPSEQTALTQITAGGSLNITNTVSIGSQSTTPSVTILDGSAFSIHTSGVFAINAAPLTQANTFQITLNPHASHLIAHHATTVRTSFVTTTLHLPEQTVHMNHPYYQALLPIAMVDDSDFVVDTDFDE